MSPRSQEFLDEAHDRLEASRLALANGFDGVAASLAYYAMLYAARAALSEEDTYAKTHSGTWTLFGKLFVAEGRFDRGLYGSARETQRLREGADYDAASVPAHLAAAVVDDAARFLAAVGALLGAE